MVYAFSEIRLTREEIKLLKAAAHKPINTAKAERLILLGLVSETESLLRPGYMPVSTGEAEITDSGKNYLLFRKSELRRMYLVPIITAAATDGIIHALVALWPKIQALVLGFLG